MKLVETVGECIMVYLQYVSLVSFWTISVLSLLFFLPICDMRQVTRVFP